MKRIIAIGGGEIKDNETLNIDKSIVLASNKKNPRLLFIPTASGEPQGYVSCIERVYGKELGCKVKSLLLLNNAVSKEQAWEMILDTDIVYVGGGNTKKMLEIWERYAIGDALKEAYKKGIILSGLSAGSICWFESGHSDSLTYETGVESQYIKVKGLGILKGLHCPHHNEGNRAVDFEEMVATSNEIGIAIENNCAIDFYDDKYKITKSDKTAKAYKVYNKNGKIMYKELLNTDRYINIRDLYSEEQVSK